MVLIIGLTSLTNLDPLIMYSSFQLTVMKLLIKATVFKKHIRSMG